MKILFSFAAMMALLMVFAVQRIPGAERIEVPQPAIPEPQTSVHKVDRLPAVRKIETDRVVASTDPVPIKTETVRPDPAPSVPALVALPQDAEGENGPEPKYKRRVRERYASVESNVCTRHHMRKVITRGGKSWRCKR